ncbi:MAG: efflux RND transporter periplasmic adaptor subunit [Lysobacter sp.]
MKRMFLPIAAITLLAGCSGSSTTAPTADPVALVTLATAARGDVTSTRAVYGTFDQDAGSQFTLSAPVEATVSHIAAPAGTVVERGQLVVALSPSPSTRAAIEKLSADARTAELAYERTRRLRTDGLVSDAELESARSAAQGAQASQGALATQSGQLALRAPGAGYVLAVATSPGDLVAAGTTVATISRAGDLRARFGIEPNLIGQLARDAGVRLRSSDGRQSITVPILSVDPSADPRTLLASLVVLVPEAYGVGPGQPLSGDIKLKQSSNAVTVPYAAMLDDGGQPYVFVVTADVAQRMNVELGASDGTSVAITKGVQAGQKVVTSGGTALSDGTKVRTK